jgi:hypothetical protein
VARIDDYKRTKTINEEDAIVALTDAITDLMLVYGTDDIEDPRMAVALENAIGSAVNTHYPAEIGGDSEGFEIVIWPSEGEPYKLADRK